IIGTETLTPGKLKRLGHLLDRKANTVNVNYQVQSPHSIHIRWQIYQGQLSPLRADYEISTSRGEFTIYDRDVSIWCTVDVPFMVSVCEQLGRPKAFRPGGFLAIKCFTKSDNIIHLLDFEIIDGYLVNYIFSVTPITPENFRITETVMGIQFVTLKEIVARKFSVSGVVVSDNIYVCREDLNNTYSYKKTLLFNQLHTKTVLFVGEDCLDSAIDKGADIKVLGFQCIDYKIDFYVMDLIKDIYVMAHIGQTIIPASCSHLLMRWKCSARSNYYKEQTSVWPGKQLAESATHTLRNQSAKSRLVKAENREIQKRRYNFDVYPGGSRHPRNAQNHENRIIHNKVPGVLVLVTGINDFQPVIWDAVQLE
ncbi:10267_t:CDS:10, partial [Paraglomus occultum]